MRSGVRTWLLLVVFKQNTFMTNPHFWAKCLFSDKHWGIKSHYWPLECLTVVEMLFCLTGDLKKPHFLVDWSIKKLCVYVMLTYSWPTSQKWNFEKILKNMGDTNFHIAIFQGVLGKLAWNDLNSAEYGQISLYFITYDPI